MKSSMKNLAALAALAACAGTAEASVLGITTAGGSESVLSIVNTADNSSISQDLGDKIGQLAIGDMFSLSNSVISFINNAGGLGSIRFSIVAGSASGGTSTATYLHTSDNATLSSIANSVRGTWFSTLTAYLTGASGLNSSNSGDTNGAVNGTYGPFAAGTTNRNYLAGTGTDFMADWGQAGTCAGNDNTCNLVNGSLSARLFQINFGTAPTGFANIQKFLDTGANGGALARLDLGQGTLFIEAAIVPVPAAVWLMGSALGLLGWARRRAAAAI
jgi:hypothetical protein